MTRRRPSRRPWASTALLACLLATIHLTGWFSIDIGNWLGNRVLPNTERGYWFIAHNGRIGFAYTEHPNGVGFEIDPSDTRWEVEFGRVALVLERHDRPGWQWAHTWLGFGTSLVIVAIPLWWLAAPLLAWAAWRWWRFKPLAPGECPRCRYDTAGLDACPECGETITP